MPDTSRSRVDPVTPPRAPVDIPGEPPHVTGRLPVTATGAPSTRVAVTRADAPPPVHRDSTPAAGQQRGAPARGMTQGWGPSATVVGGLIVVATVIGLILWWTLATGDDASTTSATVSPDDTVAVVLPVEPDEAAIEPTPADEAPSSAQNDTAETGLEGGTARIVSVAAFDPEGDFEENDSLAPGALADGDSSTTWRTSCYSNQFMGAKRGVGLIVSFDRPLDKRLTFDVGNGPYQVQFYEWDGDIAPTTVDDWGEPFDRSFGPEGAVVTTDPSGFAARHVLILLNEIGADDGCSTDNPFRGTIGELTLID